MKSDQLAAKAAAARAKVPKGDKPPKPPKVPKPLGESDSWAVFKAIYPSWSGRLFGVQLLMGMVITGLLAVWLTSKQIVLVYIAAGAGLLLVGLLLASRVERRIAYERYLAWRRRMPFRVEGWEVLGTRADYPDGLMWDKRVTLTIRLSNPSARLEAALGDAMFLLCKAANRHFYEQNFVQKGYAGDRRDNWTYNADTHSAVGSANWRILWELHLAVRNDLKDLQEELRGIEAVSFSFSGDVFLSELPDAD